MDYLKQLITSYQQMNDLPSNTVWIAKNGISKIIHIKRVFSADNYFEGYNLITYINNVINQADGASYHMGAFYRDDGKGEYLEEIYFEFPLPQYENLNRAIKNILYPDDSICLNGKKNRSWCLWNKVDICMRFYN